MKAIATGTLLTLASFLAACGSNTNPLEVTVERCPALAVVGGTGSLTRFAGEGRDARDILFEAAVSNAELRCDQGSDVISTVAFDIVARRGEAMAGEGYETTLPYFITVLRDNSEIVAKEIFEVPIVFDGRTARVAWHETIEQRLPTIEQARRYDYEILIGFQLTPEEVTYNLLR